MHVKEDVDKEQILNLVLEASKEATSTNCEYLEIYYTGHGQKDSGKWVAYPP